MPTPITIQLDLDTIDHLSIEGVINVTLPKVGYHGKQTVQLRGTTLQRLRRWTETRAAASNPNQFTMDGLGGEHNAKT